MALEWVLGEAGRVLERDALILVLLDPVEQPLEFDQLHAFDLGVRVENPRRPTCNRLVESIRHHHRDRNQAKNASRCCP